MFYLFTLFSVSLLCGYARSQGCYEPTGVDRMEYEAFFGVERWYVVATTRNRPFPYPAPDGSGCPTAVLEKDVNDQVTYTYAWSNNVRVWTGKITDTKQIDLTYDGPLFIPGGVLRGRYTVMDMGLVEEDTEYAVVYFCYFTEGNPLPFPRTEFDDIMILTRTYPVPDTKWGELQLVMERTLNNQDISSNNEMVKMRQCFESPELIQKPKEEKLKQNLLKSIVVK